MYSFQSGRCKIAPPRLTVQLLLVAVLIVFILILVVLIVFVLILILVLIFILIVLHNCLRVLFCNSCELQNNYLQNGDRLLHQTVFFLDFLVYKIHGSCKNAGESDRKHKFKDP